MSLELAPLASSRAQNVDVVERAWRRSVRLLPDRRRAAPRAVWTGADLRRRLAAHPLRRELPFLRRLLDPVAGDRGLVYAIGDADARVLEVGGDHETVATVAHAGLVPGADWSESAMGVNGIGTAVTTARPVLVVGPQHYAPGAAGLVCWSVPVRCPETGDVAGVLDLSCLVEPAAGPAAGSTGFELALLTAAASAVEARLARRARLERDVAARARLRVLGRRRALLDTDLESAPLSARHSEIALLLAWQTDGLSAERLAIALYDGRTGTSTAARAEMRRLRASVDRVAGPGVLSRPYAFAPAPELDVRDVVHHLDHGDVGAALAGYRGPVLPESHAPGVVAVRREVHGRLRRAVLAGGSGKQMLAFARLAENRDDTELWNACLRALPARSPRRWEAAAQLERIDAELAV